MSDRQFMNVDWKGLFRVFAPVAGGLIFVFWVVSPAFQKGLIAFELWASGRDLPWHLFVTGLSLFMVAGAVFLVVLLPRTVHEVTEMLFQELPDAKSQPVRPQVVPHGKVR